MTPWRSDRFPGNASFLAYTYLNLKNNMIATTTIAVLGMTCSGCEQIIEEQIKQIPGVHSVRADFKHACVRVEYDDEKTSLSILQKACQARGYTLTDQPLPPPKKVKTYLLATLAFLGLFALLLLARKVGHLLNIPAIGSEMGNGMILLVGLFTGIHCIGMCGSFIIGYTSNDAEKGRSSLHSHLLYGVGKTLSYALLGAFFGQLGALFHLSALMSGLTLGLAGLFLILYGLNMLHIFALLKFLHIKQPAPLTSFLIKKRRKNKSPFIIGFLSGFILGCGPLQAMYIMAAGNGNALEGAKFLALFGLGTLPALFCFGMIARLLSQALTKRFFQATGLVLILLGVMMINKGFSKARFVETGSPTNSIQSCCEQSAVKIQPSCCDSGKMKTENRKTPCCCDTTRLK